MPPVSSKPATRDRIFPWRCPERKLGFHHCRLSERTLRDMLAKKQQGLCTDVLVVDAGFNVRNIKTSPLVSDLVHGFDATGGVAAFVNPKAHTAARQALETHPFPLLAKDVNGFHVMPCKPQHGPTTESRVELICKSLVAHVAENQTAFHAAFGERPLDLAPLREFLATDFSASTRITRGMAFLTAVLRVFGMDEDRCRFFQLVARAAEELVPAFKQRVKESADGATIPDPAEWIAALDAAMKLDPVAAGDWATFAQPGDALGWMENRDMLFRTFGGADADAERQQRLRAQIAFLLEVSIVDPVPSDKGGDEKTSIVQNMARFVSGVYVVVSFQGTPCDYGALAYGLRNGIVHHVPGEAADTAEMLEVAAAIRALPEPDMVRDRHTVRTFWTDFEFDDQAAVFNDAPPTAKDHHAKKHLVVQSAPDFSYVYEAVLPAYQRMFGPFSYEILVDPDCENQQMAYKSITTLVKQLGIDVQVPRYPKI